AREFPDEPQYQDDLARTHAQRARLLRKRQEHAAARSAYEKAVEIQDALVNDFPARPEYRQRAVRYRFGLANALEEAGQNPQARAAYAETLRRQEKLVAERPQWPPDQNYLGHVADSLAALVAGDDPAEAQRLLERSLAARREAWRLAQHVRQF